MKTIKIAIAGIIIALIAFLIFYKTDTVDIGGIWYPKKIVLDNEPLYPTKRKGYFTATATEIIINDWSDSLYIFRRKDTIHVYNQEDTIPVFKRDTIRAGFAITKNSNGKHQIRLTSAESSLNGNFSLEIDTLYFGPLAYKIYVNIESDKTLLNFNRTVRVEPQKVERHKRGVP